MENERQHSATVKTLSLRLNNEPAQKRQVRCFFFLFNRAVSAPVQRGL